MAPEISVQGGLGRGTKGDSACKPIEQYHPLSENHKKNLLFPCIYALAPILKLNEDDAILAMLIREEKAGRTYLEHMLTGVQTSLSTPFATQPVEIQASFLVCLHYPLLSSARCGHFRPYVNVSDRVIANILGTDNENVWQISKDIANLFAGQALSVIERLDVLKGLCRLPNVAGTNS